MSRVPGGMMVPWGSSIVWITSALAAREPNGLDEIRALRPDGPVDALDWQPTDDELFDRMHGAWTGRCIGCAQGKPVEGPAMKCDDNGVPIGRTLLKEYLESKHAWPLADYIPESTDEGDIIRPSGDACREHIAFMPADDRARG